MITNRLRIYLSENVETRKEVMLVKICDYSRIKLKILFVYYFYIGLIGMDLFLGLCFLLGFQIRVPVFWSDRDPFFFLQGADPDPSFLVNLLVFFLIYVLNSFY